MSNVGDLDGVSGDERHVNECIHLIDPATCSWCSGQEARRIAEAKALADNTRVIVAQYEGQCVECNLPIHVGDTIKWRPDWPPMHEACAP